MPTPSALEDILSFALRVAAIAAAEIEASRSKDDFSLGFKGEDFVTSTDIQVDSLIRANIHKNYPNHKYVSEELAPQFEGENFFAGPCWIVDPIDGTTNFVREHKHVCVSMAYAENGEVLVGVVNAPFLGEIYHAIKGHGAFLNGLPISCSKNRTLKDSVIATGFSQYRHSKIDLIMGSLKAVLTNCRDIRRNGAAAIDTCWVACARLDGYYEDVNPWDIAAAALIAREAGAQTGNFGAANLANKLPIDIEARGFTVAAPCIYKDLEKILVY